MCEKRYKRKEWQEMEASWEQREEITQKYLKGTETKSSTQKIKETDSQDNMGVTSRTEPIGNYQKGQI